MYLWDIASSAQGLFLALLSEMTSSIVPGTVWDVEIQAQSVICKANALTSVLIALAPYDINFLKNFS